VIGWVEEYWNLLHATRIATNHSSSVNHFNHS
jgi:hypothetical protein